MYDCFVDMSSSKVYQDVVYDVKEIAIDSINDAEVYSDREYI